MNRAWRENVAKSLEWAALEVVRVDTPGFVRYLEERRECRPSLRERVEDELKSISVLLSERLVDFALQLACLQSRTDGFRKGEGTWSSLRSSTEFDCACMKTEIPCSGKFHSYSESLLPRHSVRV